MHITCIKTVDSGSHYNAYEVCKIGNFVQPPATALPSSGFSLDYNLLHLSSVVVFKRGYAKTP
jgi:hypothetical protein